MNKPVSSETIEQQIFLIRGQKVMVDRDLAILYGVKTKYLNQQVRRNIERFPEEFMFQLTSTEKDELVAICNRFNSMKHSTTTPLVFTEHGVTMLAGVYYSSSTPLTSSWRHPLHRHQKSPKDGLDFILHS